MATQAESQCRSFGARLPSVLPPLRPSPRRRCADLSLLQPGTATERARDSLRPLQPTLLPAFSLRHVFSQEFSNAAAAALQTRGERARANPRSRFLQARDRSSAAAGIHGRRRQGEAEEMGEPAGLPAGPRRKDWVSPPSAPPPPPRNKLWSSRVAFAKVGWRPV